MAPPVLSTIVVKDGNNNPQNITALDFSGGTGAGPWTFGKVIVDGVTGTNLWNINSSGQGRVLAAQEGAWTVQQGGAPWSVSQSGIWDIRNITGSVSLPTGAATAAKQPNFGTIVSPSPDILSVQAAQGAPLDVDTPVMGTNLGDLLNSILQEMRIANILLAEGLNVNVDLAAARSDPTLDPAIN